MKIGLVLNNVPPYSETFFRSKINGLLANGFDVVLFVNRRNKEEIPANWNVLSAPDMTRFNGWKKVFLPVHFLTVYIGLFFCTPFRTLRFIEMERKEGRSWNKALKNLYLNAHILPENLDWLHFGFATLSLGREHTAKVLGAKMGVSFRGYDINVFPLKHPECYSSMWKNTDKVHTLSDNLVENAQKLGMPKTLKYTKITPAVDLTLFVPPDGRNRESAVLSVITVGRLHWTKGYEYALKALSMLDSSIYWHYTIVGDGPLRDKLVFLSHLLGIEEKVTFAGARPHTEIVEMLHNHQLYIQPSVSEGFCNAALEAQAAGLSVIVSNAGALPENVLDGETGWVVPKRQPTALREKIEMVYHLTETEKEAVAQTAVDRVKNQFDLTQQMAAWLRFFRT